MNNITLQTLIFIDGGDPGETAEAKRLLGYIDGQTTNPTLISKNPEVASRLAQGKRFTLKELLAEYKKIVQEVAQATDGPTSIEVHADKNTTAEAMLEQARDMSTWIPSSYIKFPCTHEGIKAASVACKEMRINLTLNFSIEQAAAVYVATLESKYEVFLSPFVGRLDDKGLNGMDVVKNELHLFREFGDGHVQILTASLRNLDHLLYCLKLSPTAITLPFKVFKEWADKGFPQPDENWQYDRGDKEPIPMPPDITLDKDWEEYNIAHELTDAGIRKFAQDWNKLLIDIR